MITAEMVRKSLPSVGDILTKRTVAGIKSECRVIFVSSKHLWYMVEFFNLGGVRECFKLPKTDYTLSRARNVAKTRGQFNHTPIKVKIVETGEIFNSLAACGERIGVKGASVGSAARIGRPILRKYHVVLV